MQSSQQNPMSFLPEFYCALSGVIMNNPVTDSEGNTYEQESIEEYLKNNSVSPVTGKQLTKEEIVVNDELRSRIDAVRHLVNDETRYIKNIQKANSNVHQSVQENAKEDEFEKAQEDEIRVKITRSGEEFLVSVNPPAGSKQSVCDICCVIDVSGSMNTEAQLKDDQGQVEKFGLTILDLVKHSVKTIIANCTDSDRLSLVAFHTTAEVITHLTPMTAEGKKKAIEQLDNLVPLNTTNIWDGLYKGLEVMREGQEKEQNRVAFSQILLFTDGLPNVEPPRGHVPMLKQYKEKNQKVNCQISTFGFGYDLDSQLLEALAIEGRGSFAFIPDASFVGTIFVNAFSNLRTTVAVDATLCLENSDICQFITDDVNSPAVLGDHEFEVVSWGLNVKLGQIQLGQSRDIVVRMRRTGTSQGEFEKELEEQWLRATLKYKVSSTSQICQEAATEYSAQNQKQEDEKFVVGHAVRSRAVTAMKRALLPATSLDDSKKIINQVITQEASRAELKDMAIITDLKTDLTGEVNTSFSTAQIFNRWGKHFIRSITRAHQIQQCNNFKDPGVQHYGGALFKQVRDLADEAFLSLPPPKPKVVKNIQSGQKGQAQQPQKQVQMNRFHNMRGGCFHGSCEVSMVSGQVKQVKDIAVGDLVLGGSGKLGEFNSARVLCVVRIDCKDGVAELVELPQSSLLVTPYHPVRFGPSASWQFPSQIAQSKIIACDYVYTFVLESCDAMKSQSSMLINGVECVTLAHGLQEDVAKHAYFGSKAVLNDLKNQEGWEDGLVCLPHNAFIRDSQTSLVVGIRTTRGRFDNIQEQAISPSLMNAV